MRNALLTNGRANGRERGASSLEAIVSFTLLSAALTFATPLIIKHGRLLKAQRDYRLALDEVSNQLERLSALPERDLSRAMEQLVPSEFVADRLPGAAIRGELHASETGRRLTVRLSWNEQAEIGNSVALATWIPPVRSASNEARSSP